MADFGKGSRLRLEVQDGTYEGIVVSFDPRQGLMSLKAVSCLTSGRSCPGLMHFTVEEIVTMNVVGPSKQLMKGTTSQKNGSSELKKSAGTNQSSDSGTDLRPSNKQSQSNSSSQATKSNHHNSAAPLTKPPVKSEQALQKTVSTVQATGGSDDFKNYVVLDELNDTFYSTIEAIKHSSLVAMAMEGSDLSRNGQLCWIQFSTKTYIFLFDILSLGDAAFTEGLGDIIEDGRIQKIVHDCRGMSDILHHRYQLHLINVFDTQVADVMVYRLNNSGQLPRNVQSLIVCILQYLHLSVEQTSVQRSRENTILNDKEVWSIRPADSSLLKAAIFNVYYLHDLRLRLLEGMLAEFTDGVDVYLSLHRDASNKQLERFEDQSFTVPMEFQNLAWCADQSRKNTSDILSRRRIYAEKSKQPIAAAPSDDKIQVQTNRDRNETTTASKKVNENKNGNKNENKKPETSVSSDSDSLTLAEVYDREAKLCNKKTEFQMVAAGHEQTKWRAKPNVRPTKSRNFQLDSSYETGPGSSDAEKIIPPPAAPVTSTTRPAAPVTSTTRPAAPVTSTTRPAAPVTSTTPPAAPVTSTTPPAAPVTSTTPPAAPSAPAHVSGSQSMAAQPHSSVPIVVGQFNDTTDEPPKVNMGRGKLIANAMARASGDFCSIPSPAPTNLLAAGRGNAIAMAYQLRNPGKS